MPTIDHRARSAQDLRSFFQSVRVPRTALGTALARLVLLAAVAGAVYLPGALAARLSAASPAHAAAVSAHPAVAARPLLPCPGVTAPC